MKRRIPEDLVKLYGNADAADEAIRFFRDGPGRAIVTLLEEQIQGVSDVRYRLRDLERLPMSERGMVWTVRAQLADGFKSLKDTLQADYEEVDEEDEEGGGDETE